MYSEHANRTSQHSKMPSVFVLGVCVCVCLSVYDSSASFVCESHMTCWHTGFESFRARFRARPFVLIFANICTNTSRENGEIEADHSKH